MTAVAVWQVVAQLVAAAGTLAVLQLGLGLLRRV